MDKTQEKTNGETELDLNAIGTELELPARLSQEDLELFKPALNNCIAATRAREHAQNQLAIAQRNEAAASGAVSYVAQYLGGKYGMKPTDDIDEDGVIIRK